MIADDRWRLFGRAAREFFGRQAFEAVPHDVAMGEGKVEAIGVSEEAADAGVTDDGEAEPTLVVGYDAPSARRGARAASARRATGDGS